MTVREWLNRNYKLAKELETKQACLETIIGITSRFETDGIMYGNTSNSSEIKFLRWSELKAEVERLTEEVNAVDRETDGLLRQLDNSDEYRVLYCRYVRRMEWGDIMKCFGYNKRSMFRFHSEGIRHVCELETNKFERFF